jgi:uracil-DNA glycosylase family 4
MSKYDSLKEIRDEVFALKESPLYEYRISNHYFPVLGEGNHDAAVMIIGEAPGKNEAMSGRPFAGAAGKILDELLAVAAIERKDVYITNIVKDRPQENRDPTSEEIEIYGPFLDRQVEVIQPKVIATLGRFSMGYILSKFGLGSENIGISKLHGKAFDAETSYGSIKILALYHPAAAIYNQSLKETLREDFAKLKELV